VPDRLTGKVALVTGAAKGMGEATARLFAREGAMVFVSDIDVDAGKVVASELESPGYFVRLDVTRADEWSEAAAECHRRGGRLDILVNNAGFAESQPIEAETVEYHEAVLRTNVTGVWNGIRAVLPAMTAQRSGSIINISSMDGIIGVPGMTSFVASKFAVTGMTKSVALEVGHRGIRVNSIHPGAIATHQMRGREDAVYRSLQIEHQAIPRIGRPEEVANLALFLASDDSSYCTGGSFVIDGGHTAGPYRANFDYG
jgi:3alpha(or 20beta)-hydroxysteroid dehydrogenase